MTSGTLISAALGTIIGLAGSVVWLTRWTSVRRERAKSSGGRLIVLVQHFVVVIAAIVVIVVAAKTARSVEPYEPINTVVLIITSIAIWLLVWRVFFRSKDSGN